MAAVSAAIFFLFIYLQVDCQTFDIQRSDIPVQAFCNDGEVSGVIYVLYRRVFSLYGFMVVYWYYDVVPTFKKIVPPAVVPGLLGGDSAPPDSREKCSQSVPRPSWVLPHRDAWCLLRYLLLSLCLDLWTFRSRGIIYTSVRTLFPTFCFQRVKSLARRQLKRYG